MSSAIRRRVLTAAAGCGIMYTCMARAEGKLYYSLAIDRGAMTVKEGYSLRKFSSKLEYKDKK